MPVGKKSIQRAIDAQNKTEQPAAAVQAKQPEKVKKEPQLTMVELDAICTEGRTGVYELERLKTSIRDYGVLEPVLLVCDGKTCRLADGYGRYLAAKELGMTKLPAIVVEGSKAAAARLQKEIAQAKCCEAPRCDDIHEEKFRVISRISSDLPVILL